MAAGDVLLQRPGLRFSTLQVRLDDVFFTAPVTYKIVFQVRVHQLAMHSKNRKSVSAKPIRFQPYSRSLRHQPVSNPDPDYSPEVASYDLPLARMQELLVELAQSNTDALMVTYSVVKGTWAPWTRSVFNAQHFFNLIYLLQSHKTV